MSGRIETVTVKVSNHWVRREPDEKAIERKITEMGADGWVLTQRSDYNGLSRFDAHTRLTFQRYAR